MLTQALIARSKGGKKIYRLLDHDRLFLEVRPTHSKAWTFIYRYNGKRDTITLGRYPEMSLEDARDAATEARHLLVRGVDPATRFRLWHKQASFKVSGEKERTQANTVLFREVVEEYYRKREGLLTKRHIDRIERLFATHLYPSLGDTPVNRIKPLDLLHPLQYVEEHHSVETAHRLLNWTGQVFRYAIATQKVMQNPAIVLKGALRPLQTNHHPAITHPAELGELLLRLEKQGLGTSTRVALSLLPHVFVRPGELRKARWEEFDIQAIQAGKPSVWEIPAERMKMKQPHVVPLSSQATALLALQWKRSGGSALVFPSNKDTPISDAAMLVTLRNMGYAKEKVVPHGFRATARTLLDEVLRYPPAIIEHQLAHVVRDPLGRAYNRTQHIEQRTVMMQAWSDWLDAQRETARTAVSAGSAPPA